MARLLPLLFGWWVQVWPNLAASVIWATPVVWVHHRRLKRHHRRLIDELRAQLRGDDEVM